MVIILRAALLTMLLLSAAIVMGISKFKKGQKQRAAAMLAQRQEMRRQAAEQQQIAEIAWSQYHGMQPGADEQALAQQALALQTVIVSVPVVVPAPDSVIAIQPVLSPRQQLPRGDVVPTLSAPRSHTLSAAGPQPGANKQQQLTPGLQPGADSQALAQQVPMMHEASSEPPTTLQTVIVPVPNAVPAMQPDLPPRLEQQQMHWGNEPSAADQQQLHQMIEALLSAIQLMFHVPDATSLSSFLKAKKEEADKQGSGVDLSHAMTEGVRRGLRTQQCAVCNTLSIADVYALLDNRWSVKKVLCSECFHLFGSQSKPQRRKGLFLECFQCFHCLPIFKILPDRE